MEPGVTIKDVHFKYPIANAAGIKCKTVEEVRALSSASVGAIWTGSFTIDERPETGERDYWSGPLGSLNSRQLPNGGMEFCKRHMPEMAAIAHSAGKPLIASAAGFSPDEYVRLTQSFLEAGADGVELDFGCPNAWYAVAGQKRIVSYDSLLMHQVFLALRPLVIRSRPFLLIVKLSPVCDPFWFSEIGKTVIKSGIVDAVTLCNTFPNAFAFDYDGERAIQTKLNNGLAGFGGRGFKPIALGQVRQFYSLLRDQIADDKIKIIGVGGVESGQDMWEYRRGGASMVQIGTAFEDEGLGVFERVLGEYKNIVEKKEI